MREAGCATGPALDQRPISRMMVWVIIRFATETDCDVRTTRSCTDTIRRVSDARRC